MKRLFMTTHNSWMTEKKWKCESYENSLKNKEINMKEEKLKSSQPD